MKGGIFVCIANWSQRLDEETRVEGQAGVRSIIIIGLANHLEVHTQRVQTSVRVLVVLPVQFDLLEDFHGVIEAVSRWATRRNCHQEIDQVALDPPAIEIVFHAEMDHHRLGPGIKIKVKRCLLS